MKQISQVSPRTNSSAILIGAAACALFTMLLLRLGDIQLAQGQTFQEQADENRFFRQVLPAQRGLILDRYGDPLVWNIQQYFQVSDPKVLFPVNTPITRDAALQLIATQGAEAVTTRPQRLYRFPGSLAHEVGYVGEVTAEDLQRQPELKPGMSIGKAGLELQYQKSLQGLEGKVTYEVNALGQKQRQVQVQAAVNGKDLGTSLDPYLTEFVSRQLGNSLGAVVITDAATGKVLSLTSKPAFDPNIFSQVSQDPEKEAARKETVKSLFLDPRNLFFNRAISGAYPPGSVFKLMTALAGLEDKKIDESTQVVDNGELKVGEYSFGNWYYGEYGRTEGSIGLVRAISRSNDIYFYKVAEWLGPNALAEFSRTFGLGSKTGIELPAEARGLVPDTEWKERVIGEKWFLGNTYHFGIGQGDVTTTPVQIAQMSQALANDGMLCPLSILAGDNKDGNMKTGNSAECRQVGISSEHWKSVLEGMIGACSQGGTAFPFFKYNSKRVDATKTADYNFANGAVACKTGTAEFGGADEKGRRRTHAWFTALLNVPTSTGSAQVATTQNTKQVDQLSDDELHTQWLAKAKQFGFPSKITITVLIESDDTTLFREGSADGGPIALKIVEWLEKP